MLMPGLQVDCTLNTRGQAGMGRLLQLLTSTMVCYQEIMKGLRVPVLSPSLDTAPIVSTESTDAAATATRY